MSETRKPERQRKEEDMKKLIWAAMGIGVVAIAALAIVTWQSNPSTPTETAVPSTKTPAPSVNPPPRTSAPRANPPNPTREIRSAVKEAVQSVPSSVEATPTPATQPVTARPATAAKPTFSPAINQALQTLLTPQGDYAQKQAAWKQLAESGKLDQAIKELEHQTGEDPSDAVSLAVLGQAYLNKCGASKDVREQGILGMKADMSFEAALKLDPKNWEARLIKAAAMSYWPPELNKSQEVMENLVTLVEQQEAQAARPEYAYTYVLLGDQYLKAGYPDMARDMWQRGARLYPNDGALSKKLAGQP
jgi:tetratricopeptide (TPR) repeat protein